MHHRALLTRGYGASVLSLGWMEHQLAINWHDNCGSWDSVTVDAPHQVGARLVSQLDLAVWTQKSQ